MCWDCPKSGIPQTNNLHQRFPTFSAPGPSFMEDNFSTGQGRDGDGLGMIQAYYMYCGCYFYYLLLSFTSDHQALDPRG